MEKFGTELKKYIIEENLKVYDLAKKVNIDRTLLQHVFTGKRTLKPEQFAKLVNEDYFSSDEIEDLRELYIRENQTTEDTENKIQFIFDELKKSKPDRPDTHPIDIEKTKKAFSKDDILSFINSLLEASECKQVYTNLSLTENGVGEVLYYALSKKSVEDFKALIYKDLGISCNNLKSIFIAMELARIGCFVRETSIEIIEGSQTIAPYFLIVDDAMLLFNNEISSAALIRDENLIDLYMSEFSVIYEKATERIFLTDNIFDLQSLLSSSFDTKKERGIAFDSRLCGMFNYEFDDIYSAADKQIPNADGLINLFINHCNHLSEVLKANVPFSAIDDFAETGRIWSLPESYLGRFPQEVRIKLLKKMLFDLKEDKLDHYGFINSDKLDINRNLMFNEFSDFLTLALLVDEPDCFYGDIQYKTDDFQIRDDFAEFIKYLQLNGYYLTKSSVIAKLETLILLYGGKID